MLSKQTVTLYFPLGEQLMYNDADHGPCQRDGRKFIKRKRLPWVETRRSPTHLGGPYNSTKQITIKLLWSGPVT